MPNDPSQPTGGVACLLLAYLSVLLPLVGCHAAKGSGSRWVPLQRTAQSWRFDTDGNGKADFALLANDRGRMDVLAYDDDEDGQPDRIYRASDHDRAEVPHLIVLLDSIPYRSVAARYDRGDWPWFAPPTKVIPPFPTMSGPIFSTILGAPPLPGMINRHYDARSGSVNNGITRRALGAVNPWQARLHYGVKYWENGLAFLQPRWWYRRELERAKRALDASPDRVTIVYLASASGMVSRYGEPGADEVLGALDELCLDLLHQRQGAIRISILSDHGHNYTPGRRFDLAGALQEAGFHPSPRLRRPGDVVIDMDGMMNYTGLHTTRPAEVAAALVERDEVELAAYLRGEQVVVQDRRGHAVVEHRDGRLRYRPMDADVLGYGPVLEQLRARGQLDAEGFASADAWLQLSADHQFPDAPLRLWRAFHGMVVSPPSLMLTFKDGYYVGLGSLELFIRMRSTHGGLDQDNSAAFLMGTTAAPAVLRSSQVLGAVEPGYVPAVRR